MCLNMSTETGTERIENEVYWPPKVTLGAGKYQMRQSGNEGSLQIPGQPRLDQPGYTEIGQQPDVARAHASTPEYVEASCLVDCGLRPMRTLSRLRSIACMMIRRRRARAILVND